MDDDDDPSTDAGRCHASSSLMVEFDFCAIHTGLPVNHGKLWKELAAEEFDAWE